MFGKGGGHGERKYYHFKLSCNPNDNPTPQQSHLLAEQIASEIFNGHECVIATHGDTNVFHTHIIINSVNFETGKKFRMLNKELRVQSEKTRLELEVASAMRLMDIQKEQYVLLMENAEAVRTQRHDLRHQLAVVKSYSSTKDINKLNEYLDELIAKIPSDKEMVLCENFAVNAVAAHYISIAENEGIDVSVKLVIPPTNEQVHDSDLCIIIGNFLENAIEACRKITNVERFIKLKSNIKSDYLIIVMDNSFNGNYKLEGDTYFSQKHEGVGIGLSSVKSVAQKYGGSVQFEPDGNVFLSSAMVKIKGVNEINDCNI